MQLIDQYFCMYNMSSLRPWVSRKGELCEGRHRGGSWMGCSCPHLSHENVPKCGEGVQGKTSVIKKRPLKTVVLAVKL